jgi:DNA-directed RNA polymerase alpha subunit
MTIGELIQISREELRALRGVGEGTVRRIDDSLKILGLSLKGE